ncbi:Endonuclease/Exonuclease/phosphatase family protein [Streptomyces sp. YIM 121038]|uniref:endonuclease/exonuclease/phosphatase family protein n=1 Tax=unclassified Streptomyces TaxID=2593676 RepID=UPI001110E432|nr:MULTISPECIES: endonuclease/exonuclease/phosphatase family protein [unclassified Streptomyces]QCX81010.1 Endonuclease/Exonuclease/phosphatase family protein [Streptomyces sp. YIM 121038]
MPTDTPVTRRSGLRTAVATATAVTVPLLATAFAAAPAHAAERPGRRLEVMTFNLRYASPTPPNAWPERRPVTRELLHRARPHVIGTQEGLYQQVRDIAEDLGPHYAWIGTGRAGGSRDEFMTVYYDTRRLTPVAYEHFWLSDTPEVIGSNTWGGGSVRMVTWVRFHDRRTEREFYFLNTHLDNHSQYARTRAAHLISDRLSALDRTVPKVVTGDFNVAAHKNPVYETLLKAGLVDTWDAADERGKQYATFHGYKPLVPDGDRIDWILATPAARVHAAAVNVFSLDGQFPSDHLPVQASLTL